MIPWERSVRFRSPTQKGAALRLALLACACIGLGAGEALSQETPPDSPVLPLSDIRLTLFAGVVPGHRVLIEARDVGTVEGQLEGTRRDTLYLATAAGRTRVPFSSVDRLWVQGRATWKYAKGGAVLGGVLGGILFGSLAPLLHSVCETGDCGKFTAWNEIGAILGGGVFGGFAGGAAGAVVGAAVPSWHLRYQSAAAARAPRTPSGGDVPRTARGDSKTHGDQLPGQPP